MDVCWPVPASSEGTYLVDLCVLTHLCIWIKMGSEPQCDDYLGHTDRCCYWRYSPPKAGAHWVHGESLRFATSSNADEKLVVSIYEFQPTSTPLLLVVNSFPVPFYSGVFHSRGV